MPRFGSVANRIQIRSFSKSITKHPLVPPSSSSIPSDKFAFFVDNCSDAFSLRKLHARILALGLGNHIFLGSKLLNCYAKLELVSESRWVFDAIVNGSLSLWNSILVGYYRTGHFREVVRRYIHLRQWNIGLDSAAITFGCKSCIELSNLELGRGIHADAFKFGLNANGFVGSSLIGLYCGCGDIGDAYKVFDEITDPDVVVYTSIITGYAHIGDFRAYEAFEIAGRMQRQGLHPNRVTLVSLLQAASQLDALKEGRSVHGYAIRRGIGGFDEVFETSLMDMYNKCGAPKMAACIFGKMKKKTIGLWNVMIAGYLKSEQPLEAFRLFCQVMQEKYVPDLITFSNGILSCAHLSYLRQGKSIHGHLIRVGVELDLVATTSLVDLYSKCHKLIQARALFDRMEKKDAILYDVMMAGYLHNYFASEAMDIFLEMVEGGVKLNLGSILSVLSATSELKDIRKGKCIHGYVIRHGFDLNVEIANQTIYMYSKCGHIVCARQIFNKIIYRDLVSWTSMMMGYVHHGHADEAIFLFRLMQREQVEDDTVALLTLLQALCQLGCLNLVKEVHCHLYRVNTDNEISLTNSLITAYSKCGKLNMAANLFDHAVKRCPTSWNAMILAYGMHGKCMEALMVFEQMKSEKVEPDEVTFTSILTACSHSGMVNEGLRVFKSMVEDFSIIPCEEHYGCMVDLLSRAGLLEEAYKLVKSLPSRLRGSTLGTLLAACKLHGNTEMGEDLGRRLLDLEPKNSSAFAMVSSLYAEGGKWGEVVRIRATEKGRGLKRTPGYSLIQVD
ncbi:putative tetratricopeptide-like helical domain-containing protein [Rosa chinensis]|uniref:Putative tetratricopeptide-like helical domain-containing protein n=1 Tax=Rosa chinensis TaxID=74649 RepID=A0A2P6SAH8_ROSCH|nr:pentatricopeptide repeat-containing protein At3g16610 isoform X2 [Rosa chinensis]XP_040368313.1 pentatricopeptide repeat-containing protein At3g16610 isoform X2 [Rosa chinensis]XP_040368315.1 pentatricopeptide repeat-containing protein At3g16610 isoform X2 [Rosa chinensis]PRQ55700.1 putative tetratricopeptide-like helical domain-containing protein [Rosa chinensis]